MELSILHIFVDHTGYKGILRFSITREFHNLCIEMKLYHITLQSPETIDVFRKNLDSDPNNPNLIEIIPTKQVLHERYHLTDCEKLVDYILSVPESNRVSFQLDLSPNFTCVFEKAQVRRIYNFFNSFVTNFALLDSVFKLYISIIETKTSNSEVGASIGDTKESIPTISKPFKLEIPVVTKPITESNIDLAPKSEIEYILDNYCINSLFKTFVIQHIFNYLRYISDSINISTESTNETEIIVINTPVLFDNFYYTLNYDYVISIFKNTFLETDENVISFNQKKILETIINNFEKPQDLDNKLTLCVLLFIFYSYQYRTIISQYPEFEFDNYFTPEIQEAGINFFISKHKITKLFKVKILEEISSDETSNDEKINNISSKFKHLIPVSEIDFLDTVISEYNKPKEDLPQLNITLGTSKILDIELMMKSSTIIDKIKKEKSQTIDTTNYSRRSCALSLINFEEKKITQTYQYFKDYIDNPTTLTSLLLLKELPVPKQILKLFDFFSRNLQKIFTNNKENNTLNYYQTLVKHLPSPKSYDYQTYLYLIYNLIIPYHFENFKIKKFVDSFL